jgi:hypothetical protein
MGNCWDNAPTESSWDRLKVCRLDGLLFAAKCEAMDEVMTCLTFYNRSRLHSTLEQARTPAASASTLSHRVGIVSNSIRTRQFELAAPSQLGLSTRFAPFMDAPCPMSRFRLMNIFDSASTVNCTRGVLLQTPVTNFADAPQALDHSKNVFDSRTNF